MKQEHKLGMHRLHMDIVADIQKLMTASNSDFMKKYEAWKKERDATRGKSTA